jgi:hypothetical protein
MGRAETETEPDVAVGDGRRSIWAINELSDQLQIILPSNLNALTPEHSGPPEL